MFKSSRSADLCWQSSRPWCLALFGGIFPTIFQEDGNIFPEENEWRSNEGLASRSNR